MTPAEHAAAILESLRGLDQRQVESALARADAPALVHADALADAADHDDESVRSAGIAALFGGLIEPLNDAFTPAGRAAYAALFARIAWRSCARAPALAEALAGFGIRDQAGLRERYARARAGAHAVPASARTVLVLSRVTIGADILLASVALARLAQRYPAAELVLLGDTKLAGLFGGLPRVRVRALSYARRGALHERLASWLAVVEAVRAEAPDLVLSPDSRLDQLGVLPVTADERSYMLWENLQPAGAPRGLAELFDEWLARRLSLPLLPAALPSIGLDAAASAQRQRFAAAFGPAPLAAVKLDHGGNPAKALPRPAEIELLRALRARGWRVLLDRGFGDEELANSDAVLAALGWRARDLDDSAKGLGEPVTALAADSLAAEPVLRFHGSIAGWAAALACSRLALSYDSVGHHLAAALGVPVVVAFTGYADPAFPIAWRPRGAAPVTVVEIPTAQKNQPEQWQRVIAAIPFVG